MKHLDLFSGIGGFALACQWAGIETIGFVEIDKYCRKVLRKHWPNVPIVEDIRDVEAIKQIVANTQTNRRAGCRTTRDRWAGPADSGLNADTGYSGNGNHPIILITAGFPCQPFSVAGKREGERDDRYLWPQTLAVIEAIKPEWVLLENVTGIINLALDTVLSDLEGAGYGHETLIIPACAVNAWHRRDRVWIIANSRGTEPRGVSNIKWNEDIAVRNSSQDVSLPQGTGLEGAVRAGKSCTYGCSTESGQGRWGDVWWAVEPELGRVAHGIPHRVDRLKCLGNAIVPQVAYEIIKVVAENEKQS